MAGVALGGIESEAGMALGDIPRHLAWQRWHLATSTCVLRRRRGAWRHRPSLCMAEVTLMALGWLLAGEAADCCVAGV